MRDTRQEAGSRVVGLPQYVWDERFTDEVEAALDEDNAETTAAEHDIERTGPEASVSVLLDLRQARQEAL